MVALSPDGLARRSQAAESLPDDAAALDSALSMDGALRGVVYAGDAEMGARGAGQKTRVGDFVATR